MYYFARVLASLVREPYRSSYQHYQHQIAMAKRVREAVKE